MTYILHYSDDAGNKVYLPEDVKLQPKGEFNFIFRGSHSVLTIGKNAKLVKCNFVLGEHSIITIGDNCIIKGKLLTSNKGSKITIGNQSKFNDATRIHAAEGCTISIGEGCLFANVRFRTSDSHSIIDLSTQQRINHAGDIVIEDRVWIAENVYVYKGVTVGTGSVVGARSTVTRDLPANSLCVGTPAKAVKHNIAWCDKLI